MEGTARVFAGEYSASTLQVRAEGADDPWVVTPGGAWCRGMYLAGALTELVESGDMLRCRVADPTGAFDLVTGGRKSAVSDAIRNLPVPSFITVIGQARIYQKGEKTLVSVRPDDVRVVDRTVRDQWVLATAESTLVRLGAMNLALRSPSGDQRILAAVRHYAVSPTRLLELGKMVGDAVQSIKPPESATPAQPLPDARDVVFVIVKGTGGPRGISIEEVIAQAAALGVPKEAVLIGLESLITEDECYQPQKGFVKAL
jgi:uncharacterized protein